MSKRIIGSPPPPPETERPKVCDERHYDTIYEPLPAGEFIRVLKLQPGKADQALVCNLEVVDIEQSKGSYEAISYVWGEPNSTIDILCNGLQILVTISLADALRNFRHPSQHRVLWADALCINQKDDQEKGHQVKRMGEVYANAKCTLVWLGCDDQNIARDTFALILEVNACLAELFLQADRNLYRLASFTKPYPISMDRERWLGVTSLFKFPWFRRVWTVQESAIANECRLYWGPVSIDIADALETCVWLSRKQDFEDTIRSVVRDFMCVEERTIEVYLYYNAHRPKRWQQSRMGLDYLATSYRKSTFTMLLRASRYLKASDPRDHVYAFLGCPVAIASGGRTFVEADYTCSIDDLNLRLAHALIENAAEGPFLLSAVRHNSRDRFLDGMHPSWLPEWHVAGKRRVSVADPDYWFQAGGTRELFSATQHGEKGLSVGAYTFDTVIWRSFTIQRDHAEGNLTDVSNSGLNGVLIDTLWDDVMQCSSRLGIAVRHVDFWRSLALGYRGNSSFSAISDETQQDFIDAYKKSIRVARPGDQEAVMEVYEIEDATWVKKSLDDLYNSSMFLTSHGRIGIAPLGDLVEIGDVCCIVFGATVPFLLTPAREGRHKLMSECYINGVMNGEIMEHFGQSDLSKHRIVLE